MTLISRLFIPLLSHSQKRRIVNALKDTLWSPYKGRTGKVKVQDKLSIWYEDIGDINAPPVLLLMGHSFTALAWPEYFIEGLLQKGLRLIRIDNRGVGLSSRVRDWDSEHPYTTRHMAQDAIAVLDHLELKAAHVLGVSMGGVIAQDLAIDAPDRVLTLCMAMSTGQLFDPSLSKPSKSMVLSLMRLMKKYKGKLNKESAPYMYISLINIISSSMIQEEIDYFAKACKFEYTDRLPWSFKYASQHNKALLKRGDRWSEISDISAPTMIFHGKRDPLFRMDHAEKLHRSIKGSELIIFDEMAHFLRLKDNTRVIEGYYQFISTYL